MSIQTGERLLGHLLIAGAVVACEAPTEHTAVLMAISTWSKNSAHPTLEVCPREAASSCVPVESEARLPVAHGASVTVDLYEQNVWLDSISVRPGHHLLLLLPPQKRMPVTSALSLPSEETVPMTGVFPTRRNTPTLIRFVPLLWRTFPVPVSIEELYLKTHSDGDEGYAVRNPVKTLDGAIEEINSQAGFRVFAGPHAHRSDGQGGIVVTFTSALHAALGSTAVKAARCGYDEPNGFACSPQWIETAHIYVDVGADEQIIQHELFHALGFDHTCVVPSIMASHFTSEELRLCGEARYALGLHGPLPLQRELSVFDVAGLHVVRGLSATLEGWQAHSVHWIEMRDPVEE